MEKKSVIIPIMYYDYNTKEEKQIGTVRRANVENIQENFVPGRTVLDIMTGFEPCSTKTVYVHLHKTYTWKDVFNIIKGKIFKVFKIKSSLDKLFIKQKPDFDFSNYIEEQIKNTHTL